MELMRNIWRKLSKLRWYLEATVMLAAARFLIKFVPFRYWRNTLGDLDSASLQKGLVTTDETKHKAAVVGRWVRNTAREMPLKAVCLPQAMAGRWI